MWRTCVKKGGEENRLVAISGARVPDKLRSCLPHLQYPGVPVSNDENIIPMKLSSIIYVSSLGLHPMLAHDSK